MAATLALRKPQGGMGEMFSIALPMVISLSCDTVMTFTDRWFLSRLDENLMNAAFAGGLSAFAIQTFFVGLIGYSTALVAQELGARRPARCHLAAIQALWVALLAWPLLLLCIPLGHVLFPRLGLPAQQIGPQLQYFDILVAGSVLGLARGALSGFFSGTGYTRVVMLASVTSMLTNVLLVWLLVFGHWGFPALGIVGAGIGTLCAAAVGVLVLGLVWLRQRRDLSADVAKACRWCWDRELMGALLRKGTPSGMEFFLNMLAFQWIVLLLQRQGQASATSATIMFNWDMVSFVPLIGIEISTTSLVGRYIGARNYAAVRRTLGSGIKMGWLFSAVVLVAFLLFPGALVDVFRPESAGALFMQARPLAINMIQVASLYIGIEAVMLVLTGALRGSGDTFWTMCATVGLHWLLVAVLWVSLEVLHLGPLWSWLVLVVCFLSFPLVLSWRWRQARWREPVQV